MYYVDKYVNIKYGYSITMKSCIFFFMFLSVYKRNLEKDLANDTSGHFKRLMVSMSMVSFFLFLFYKTLFKVNRFICKSRYTSICSSAVHIGQTTFILHSAYEPGSRS